MKWMSAYIIKGKPRGDVSHYLEI